MKGSLQIKNDKYYVVLYIQDELGKNKQKWISTGLEVKGNKKRAEELLVTKINEYENEQRLNSQYSPETRKYYDALFCDWIQDYVKSKKNNLSPEVYVNYEKRVDEMRKHPAFINLKVRDTTTQHLIDYYNTFRARGIKDCTIKKVANVIHPALRNAYRLDLLKKDITAFIPKFKESKPPIRYFDKKDLEKFLEIIKGHKLELIFKMASYYGFRRSELVGLKWDAIDFEKKTITIKHKVIISRRKVYCSDKLKTESSFRTLPLIPEIEKDLVKHKENANYYKKIYRERYCQKYQDYVFVDEKGKILFPDNVTHQFKLLIKREGLKSIRFHDLRHSCASLLLSSGIHMKQIQEWLGHADFSTTANIYSHLDFSSKVVSAQNISNALQGVYADEDDQKQSEANNNCFVPSIHDPYKNKVKTNEKKVAENNNDIEIEEDEYNEFLEWKKNKLKKDFQM